MSVIAISREHHAGKRLVPHTAYDFARSSAVVALCGAELPLAALEFPIGFAVDGGAVLPVALLFPDAGGNAFVGADGRWLADYIPATFRAYPFVLVQPQGSGEKILCLHDTAVLSDSTGEALFTESGEPSPYLLKTRDFFIEIERNRSATAAACAALVKRELLVSWPLQIDKGDGNTVPSSLTLFRLNQEAFYALDGQAAAELWQAGAFPVAFAHLLSLGRLSHLGRMVARQQPPQAPPPPVPQPIPPIDLDRRFGITTDDAELHFNF